MKLQNLFPRDTRIIEILSAFTIMTAALLFMYDSNTPSDMVTRDTPRVFWLLSLLLLGGLQLVSLLEYPRLELIRCACGLMVGVFWLWFFLVHLDVDHSAGKFVYLFMSIGNFYSFFVAYRGLLKC